MTRNNFARLSALLILGSALCIQSAAARAASIYQATLAEPNQKTEEVDTEQVRSIVADGSAVLIDTRSDAEFAAGHIPGAHVLAGTAPQRLAAVDRLAGGDKSKALVLYCNSPFCGQSRRFADQLVAAGYSNVRRYQLGIAVWRALGGPTEIELQGIVRIYKVDATAVFVDARAAEAFAKGGIPTARNLPIATVDETINRIAAGAKQNAPLPVDDFNTRVVLFGSDGAQALALAKLLAKRPWHNVSYFTGSFETLKAALKDK